MRKIAHFSEIHLIVQIRVYFTELFQMKWVKCHKDQFLWTHLEF